MTRKILTILVVVIGLVVIVRRLLPQTGGGGDLPISEAPYIATQQTGVYLATGTDAPAYLIDAGTALRPVGGASDLDCRPVVIAGETASVCQIELVLSGRWGWVAEQDIAKR